MLASVSKNGDGATDRVLAGVVARLADERVKILGALRATGQVNANHHCESALQLLPDGPVVQITQDLGTGSTGCRMDANALEEAVGLAISRLVADGADLVVINKFGLSEAEGRGFRAFIVEALGRGVPVLIGLSDTHRTAFECFADGMASNLPPKEDAILTWCREAMQIASGEIKMV